MNAKDIITTLEMDKHPEGGWFREMFRDAPGDGGRGYSTAIYYLLEAGDRSHWHRVDVAEVWHFYAGAPLRLSMARETVEAHVLGPDIVNGQRPHIVVPKDLWQSAESLGEWTLVGCTVAPAFEFSGFEMAPKGWSP